MRCPYCATEFSGNLRECPNCGHTLYTQPSNAAAAGGINVKSFTGGVGDEIYKLGTALGWLILASGIIIGGVAWASARNGGFGIFFVIVIAFGIVAYLSTLFLRGLGQLISDTAKIRKMMEKAASAENRDK